MPLFDVALWRRWPSRLWPDYTADAVEAKNAYAAILQVVQVHRLRFVAYGCANARDGTLRYRCHGLRLVRGLVLVQRTLDLK